MFRKLITGLMISMAAFSVSAQEITTVSPAARERLTVTIYNQGIGLVKDVRKVSLKQGDNQIAFSDISDQMIPESVFVSGNGVTVQEQNFNFDLLTHDNMMQKAVGSTVDIEWTNPATGATETQKAQILAFNYGEPVLKIGNKIETKYPGRILFNQIPKNLWSKPTLILDLMSKQTATEEIELSYLSNGINWKADYVAELNDSDDKMDLNGLVTLTNNTQVSYENATLQLVAGSVNITRPQPRVMYKASAMMLAENATMDSAMGTEQLGDYYLYTLDRPTDILSNQTKQVALLSGDHVTVQKQYKFTDTINVAYTTDFKDVKPSVFLTFENKKEDGLGLPLPKGTVRVYKKDQNNRLIFVGEDNIDHTAVQQKVTLRLGQAFDITAAGKKTSYTSIGKDAYEAGFEVALNNAMKTPVQVRFEQRLPNNWRILSESQKSMKENANTVYWNVDIPPEGQTILTFKVQIQKETAASAKAKAQ